MKLNEFYLRNFQKLTEYFLIKKNILDMNIYIHTVQQLKLGI